MTLFEIAGYGIIWATAIAFLFRIGRWTLLFLTPELPNSMPPQLTQIHPRRARNRVRRLLRRLEVARNRHRDLREYVAAWGTVIVWLLIAMFFAILLCAIVTTYPVLRPHLTHNKAFFVFSSPLLVVLTLGCTAVTFRLLNGIAEATRLNASIDKSLKRIRLILSQHLPAADVESIVSALAREYSESEAGNRGNSAKNRPSSSPEP